MYIDIHRHTADKGKANICLINLLHNQEKEAYSDQIYSIGIHPWHVNNFSLEADLSLIKNASERPEIIAIGEVGLDKKINTDLDIQIKAFKSQIEIAKLVCKPMIIHCVRAYNEIYNLKISSNFSKPWLIHWFNADVQMAQQLIKKGFYLSFGHMLFKEDSKAFKSFPKIPLENIFFETDDAGYEIDEIYVRASRLLEIPLKDLEKKVENNFENFFGIKL
jgi:TatD DNase family protein